MKFLLAVVMLALAMGAQSSLLPLPYAYGPAVSHVSAWGPAAAWGAHGAWAPHGWGTPGIGLAQGLGHGYALAHGPAAIAHHVAVAPHVLAHGHDLGHLGHLGHEGHYVAKTRGAIHTAPLSGHLQSVSSLNVAPAPGTL